MADVAAERRENFLRWMKAEGLNANRIAEDTSLRKMTVSDYVTGKTGSLSGERESIIARHYGLSVDAIWGPTDPDPRDVAYVTAWRERAGLSVEALAEAIHSTVAIVEEVEAGRIPLTGKRRYAVADALGINAGFLAIDPDLAENGVLVAAAGLPAARRREGQRILEALSPEHEDRTGTRG